MIHLDRMEMAVLTGIKQMPVSTRGEIADKITITIGKVQKTPDSLREKAYIQRVGSKPEPSREVVK